MLQARSIDRFSRMAEAAPSPQPNEIEARNGDGRDAAPITIGTLAELMVIAQAVGSDFRMTVRLGRAGEGSFFDIENCVVTLDPAHVRQDPAFAKFVAAHEGSHRAITMGAVMSGMPRAEVDLLNSQLGFHAGFNGCEDNAVNTWMCRKFPGLEGLKNASYDRMFGRENVPVSLPEIEHAAAALGAYPKFGYAISEIIRDWHQGRLSAELDPEVKKTVDRILPFVRRYTTLIPPVDADYRTRIDYFRERFNLYREFVWPELRKLVERDLKNETENQLLQEMFDIRRELGSLRRQLKEAESRGDKDQKKALEKRIEELREKGRAFEELARKAQEELRKAFEKVLRDQAERLGQEHKRLRNELDQAAQKATELKKQLAEMEQRASEGALSESEEKALRELREQSAGADKAHQEAQANLQEFMDSLRGSGGGRGPAFGDLSPETQKALRELLEGLPADVRERLRNEAGRKLENFDDAVSRELEGKLNNPDSPSHGDRRAENERREAQREAERVQREEVEQVSRNLKEVRESLQTPYEKALEAIRDLIHPLYVRLKRFFRPRQDPDWDEGFQSGTRLNLRAAMQAEADPRQLSRLWDRRVLPRTFDYRFSFLVDISRSMRGEKAEETFKGLVLIAEVLERLKIPYEINCFSDEMHLVKSFSEHLKDAARSKIASLPMLVDGGTNDAVAIDIAYQRMKPAKGRDNFLVVLTDGGSSVPTQLKLVLGRIRRERTVKVVAFGLGPQTAEVVKAYPRGYPDIRMRIGPKERAQGARDFVDTLSSAFEAMIFNPEAF